MKNPDYNLAELSVETDGVLLPEAVLQAADLQKGSNIFLVNLDRAKARVEAMPQVEKVQVDSPASQSDHDSNQRTKTDRLDCA